VRTKELVNKVIEQSLVGAPNIAVYIKCMQISQTIVKNDLKLKPCKKQKVHGLTRAQKDEIV
jgi:hypothetical protein